MRGSLFGKEAHLGERCACGVLFQPFQLCKNAHKCARDGELGRNPEKERGRIEHENVPGKFPESGLGTWRTHVLRGCDAACGRRARSPGGVGARRARRTGWHGCFEPLMGD